MNLWEMSWRGAALIGAIMLIRVIAIKRLPKKTFLFLWVLALCRLAIPMELPSPLSVYNLLEGSGPVKISPAAAEMAISSEAGLWAEGMSPARGQIGGAVSPAFGIWLTVMSAMGLMFIISYVKNRRRFNASLPTEIPYVAEWMEQNRLRRDVAVRVSDQIASPLTYGILRPVILLPRDTDWGQRRCLEYILEHELTHVKRFDAISKLILAGVLCLHWFNPLVWVMYITANRDLEICCDETVLHKFGRSAVSTYAMTLVDMQEKRARLSLVYSGFGKYAIEERINVIMKYKKAKFAALTVAVVGIAVGSVFATSASSSDGVETAFSSNRADRKTYGVYEPFGLTVEDGRLYYDGKLVRHFNDRFQNRNFSATAINYYEEEGVIDVRAVRGDEKVTPELVKLEALSPAEFDRQTIIVQEEAKAREAANQGAWEDQAYVDARDGAMFTEYEPYGLTYDSEQQALIFNDERVRSFSDIRRESFGVGGSTVSNWDEEGTIDVITVRDYADKTAQGDGKLVELRLASAREFKENSRLLDQMPKAVEFAP